MAVGWEWENTKAQPIRSNETSITLNFPSPEVFTAEEAAAPKPPPKLAYNSAATTAPTVPLRVKFERAGAATCQSTHR